LVCALTALAHLGLEGRPARLAALARDDPVVVEVVVAVTQVVVGQGGQGVVGAGLADQGHALRVGHHLHPRRLVAGTGEEAVRPARAAAGPGCEIEDRRGSGVREDGTVLHQEWLVALLLEPEGGAVRAEGTVRGRYLHRAATHNRVLAADPDAS